MKTVFIDISILIQTRFLTGIQRVALEVIERLAKMPWVRLVLLTQDADSMSYRRVDETAFLKKGAARGPEEAEKLCLDRLSLDDMARYPDPVFLDIDSVWACLKLRTDLYPELKKRNIRIVTHVYDVIVISGLLAVLLAELIGEITERAIRGRRRPTRVYHGGDFTEGRRG